MLTKTREYGGKKKSETSWHQGIAAKELCVKWLRQPRPNSWNKLFDRKKFGLPWMPYKSCRSCSNYQSPSMELETRSNNFLSFFKRIKLVHRDSITVSLRNSPFRFRSSKHSRSKPKIQIDTTVLLEYSYFLWFLEILGRDGHIPRRADSLEIGRIRRASSGRLLLNR